MELEMKSTATVEQTTKIVTGVYLLTENENAAVFLINTTPKYPQNNGFNGSKLFIKGEGDNPQAEISFNDLPFDDPNIIIMADRHCMHVCIYNNKLLHALSFEGGGKVLFRC
jgi:hypothetical protein